jgi:hypothetical protein
MGQEQHSTGCRDNAEPGVVVQGEEVVVHSGEGLNNASGRGCGGRWQGGEIGQALEVVDIFESRDETCVFAGPIIFNFPSCVTIGWRVMFSLFK